MTTFFIAFILMLLALALLGIGWIITGKMKIRAGSCGRLPKQKKDEHCGKDVTCDLCKRDEEDDVQQK